MTPPIVWLLVALSVTSYLNRTVMSIVGPTLMLEVGISETEMGTVYSAFILSYAAAMVPAGWLADRVGPKTVLTAMGLGTAAMTMVTATIGWPPLTALAPLLPSLIVLRFCLGVFAAPLYPAGARAVAVATPPQEHARYQAMVIAGAPSGGALAPVLFAPIIATFGWRAAFLAAAATTVLVTALWNTMAPDTDHRAGPSHQAMDAAPQAARTDQRRIWWLAAGYFSINYFEYIFFYWIYYYFGVVRHVGATESAVYTTVLYVVMAAMMPLGGWLSDRLVPYWGVHKSRSTVAAGAMALSALLLYVGTNVKQEWVMVAFLSISLGCVAGAEGSFWAAVAERAGPDRAGFAGGIMNSVGNVGGFLAPVLTPAIALNFGWAASLHVASVMILAGAGTWLISERAVKASN